MHVDPAALDKAVAKHLFTGVATVDVDDRRTMERCEGFVHRALEAPMTADTRIAIASGSKAFPVHTLTTAAAYLPMLDGPPQKSPPGERFSCCNGGYMVLAVLLERATGGTFHEVVERLVLAPAGLERTGFLPLNALPADAAAGYVHGAGELMNTLHLPVLGNGDGGPFTTAGDLHRFWLALLDGRIVARETLDAMIAPRHHVPDERKRYGMGFWLHPTRDALILEGYDADASFRSTHLPEAQTTVSVLGNSSEGAWPLIYTLQDAVDAELGATPEGSG